MPNRDYAARSKKTSKGVNKPLILAIILLLLGVSGLALWGLKSSAPETVSAAPTQPAPRKNDLPSPPEESYTYIRELENREVPVDKNSKLAQLTKEQELLLQRQKEEEKRKQELLEQQQQALQQAQANAENNAPQQQEVEVVAAKPTEVQQQQPQKVVALTPEEFAAKKAQEQKLVEEKRKQAELKKQQEAKKAEQQAQAAQKAKEDQLKADKEKAAELAKQEKADAAKKAKEQPQTKVVAKPATEAPKTVGKFGLQCGAFKNKAQAENMQARLAMAGYNARISSSGDWNRVFVGPIGDRAAASSAQSNARSVAECLIVGM